MSRDKGGEWGDHLKKKKKIRKAKLGRRKIWMTCAKVQTLSVQGQWSICNTVLYSSLFLSKEWKRAKASKVLAFEISVLFSGAHKVFSQPCSLLILKKVNYDLGASAASWHLRFSYCWRRTLSGCTARTNCGSTQIWNTFSEASDRAHVSPFYGMTNARTVPTCLQRRAH